MASQDLFLKQLFVGPMGNCVYILGDPETKHAFIFDPAFEPLAVLAEARNEGFDVKGVIATHDHADHVGGTIFGHHIPGPPGAARGRWSYRSTSTRSKPST